MIYAAGTTVGAVIGDAVRVITAKLSRVVSESVSLGAGGIASRVEGGVSDIIVGLASRFLLRDAEGFGESLIVDYLSCAEEFDGLADVGIVGEAENVVVGGASLLLCRKILVQVGYYIALALQRCRGEGDSRSSLGINSRGVIHEIGVEAVFLDLVDAHSPGELIKYGGDDLNVSQLLRADIGKESRYLSVGHGKSLGKVAKRCAYLAIGAAELTYYDLCQCGIGVLYINRIFQFFLV